MKKRKGRPRGYIKEHRDILGELLTTNDTLDAIGKRYGLTRERIRQIGTRIGLTGMERQSQRRVQNVFNSMRELYPEHVVAVWKEATKKGLSVKGYINGPRLLNHTIFINGYMTVISHSTTGWRSSPKASRYYAHFSIRQKERTHVLVVDNPISKTREFYVLPRKLVAELPGSLYVPLNESLYPYMKMEFELESYKNAWHHFKKQEDR